MSNKIITNNINNPLNNNLLNNFSNNYLVSNTKEQINIKVDDNILLKFKQNIYNLPNNTNANIYSPTPKKETKIVSEIDTIMGEIDKLIDKKNSIKNEINNLKKIIINDNKFQDELNQLSIELVDTEKIIDNKMENLTELCIN